MKRQAAVKGPQTDEELHAWIYKNLGLNIPRIAVCEGHQAPFTFISDIYFERVTAALAMANRGGSKTMSSAVIHLLNSLFKPGCEGLTVGAIEAQSKRAYENLKFLLVTHGKQIADKVLVPADHPKVIRTIESETLFDNGSKYEIVPGTPAAVNGPHNQKVHTDEVELMDPQVFEESRNISQSKTIIEVGPDGERIERIIKAQDWITSTRKRAAGPMQRLLDSIYKAEKNGHKPPYKLYTWCYAESAKRQSNCREAFPDLPEDQKCECNQIVNGTWEDGSARRFSSVCGGKLARSDGYLELDNIHKRFMESDQDTWEAQQECSKPELGGMVFKTWSNDRYGIKWYQPLPERGPIIMSIDFGGGTTPAAVNWYQILNQDVLVHGYNQPRSEGPMKLLKAGTRVCFDEIYIAETGNIEVANMVLKKERDYKEKYEGWKVWRRFGDPANAAANKDFRLLGLKTIFVCTRDIIEQIKTCNDLLKKDLFAVDTNKCVMFPQEALAYHYPHKKVGIEYDPEKPVDDFNHTMSNFRYGMENLKVLEKKGSITPGRPNNSDNIHQTAAKSPIRNSAPRYMPR